MVSMSCKFKSPYTLFLSEAFQGNPNETFEEW